MDDAPGGVQGVGDDAAAEAALEDQIRELLSAGHAVEAIRVYHERHPSVAMREVMARVRAIGRGEESAGA